MPISTTWVSPAAAGSLDLATGAILTETWTDGVASDLLRLGGTTGQVTQSSLGIFTSSISSTSGSFVSTTDSLSMTTSGTGDVLMFAIYSVTNTITGTSCSLGVQQDAGGYTGGSDANAPVAGYNFVLVSCTKFSTPSAASHTYNTGWRCAAGTIANGTASRVVLLVELRR